MVGYEESLDRSADDSEMGTETRRRHRSPRFERRRTAKLSGPQERALGPCTLSPD